MNWLFLTFLAITARAVYSLGTRLLSRDVKVSPVTQVLLLTTTSGILAVLVSPLLGGIHFEALPQHILPMTLVIGSLVLGNIIYFKGQPLLDTGTTQIAFSSILIWGAILSVLFLDSDFSSVQVVGIGLMLGAILLAQGKASGLRLSPSILYIIFSACMFAFFQVASAGVSQTLTTGTYLVMSYLGSALVIAVFSMRQIKNDYFKLKAQLKGSILTTLFASGTSLLYFIFAYLAYRYAPDQGVVVVLLTAQVILSVIFGIFFLKETDNKNKKLLAGVLAFVASVLIKS